MAKPGGIPFAILRAVQENLCCPESGTGQAVVLADVSVAVDPSTGVAVYDSYGQGVRTGWMVFGGTSVASPIIASIYALFGNASQLNAASSLYSHESKLNDVVSGSNGTCDPSVLCTAGPSYDGSTGLGTPNGLGAF
jgi:hypothetical protein